MKNKTSLKFVSVLFAAVTMISWPDCSSLQAAEAASIDTSASVLENESDCMNIFYPLETGNQWVYKLEAQMENYIGHEKQAFTSDTTISVLESDESGILLNQKDNETEFEKQSSVQCEDQAIILYPLIELNMIIGDMANSLDFEHVSGEFMPSKKDFEDSSWSLEWETAYKVSGTLEANYEDKTFKAIFSESPLELTWKVISTDESQDVPAGSFDNLVKINREIKVDIDSLNAEIKGKQVNIGTTLIIDTDMYFAADVGLVKQTINKASIKVFGIKLPLEVQGSIDLTLYILN